MTRTLIANLRRTEKLMQPARRLKATRSFQQAMTGLIVTSALAPLAALSSKSRKAAGARGKRTLGIVLRRLKVAKALMPGAAARAAGTGPPRIPAGARFLTRVARAPLP